MPQEVGRLAVENTVASAAIVGMNVDPEKYLPEKYIPWFDRVQSFYGVEFTGNDITHVISLLVGVLVIANTTMTLYRRKKAKK